MKAEIVKSERENKIEIRVTKNPENVTNSQTNINFGKSKEIKDDKMYIYTIKQKPKQTTTYTVRVWRSDKTGTIWDRTVYVAKDEAEKKQLEKIARQREEEYKRALRNGTAHGMSVRSSKVK